MKLAMKFGEVKVKRTVESKEITVGDDRKDIYPGESMDINFEGITFEFEGNAEEAGIYFVQNIKETAKVMSEMFANLNASGLM